MAFTYNSTNIGSSGLATVRWWTGQTSSGTAILTDAEINAVLDNITSNHLLASAYCCENLSAYYSNQADTDNEGLSVKASQRAVAFSKRAADLRRRAGIGAGIYVGGRSKQEKEDRAEDTDLVQPSFTRDMHDFPGSVASSTEDS